MARSRSLLVVLVVIVAVCNVEGFLAPGGVGLKRPSVISSALRPRMSLSELELNRLLTYRKVAPSIADGSSITALRATSTISSSSSGNKRNPLTKLLASVEWPSPKTLKKLLPLGSMLFCILFNYTILRDTKDVLVVTAPNSGAEIIPFLKVSSDTDRTPQNNLDPRHEQH